MTIYVDDIREHTQSRLRYKKWSHMMTDQENLVELHEMAKRIGHKSNWFQPHPIHPHYDLVPTKRKIAIRNGAVPVNSKTMIKLCSFERK